jgi:hypothetical protein
LEASNARALAEAQKRAAEEERAEAQFEARNARANHEMLAQIFGDALKNDDPRMRGRLDRARDLLAKRYAQDPKIYANLLLQLAGRYDELGDQEREAQVMHQFNLLSARTGDGSLRANAECIEAYTLLGAGQAQEAAGHLARGFDFMHQARQDWAEAGSECYRADAMLALARGNPGHAAEQMETWLHTLESQGLTQTRSYLGSLATLANIQLQGDDLSAARLTNQRVIELNDALGSDALAACVNLDRQAEIHFELGRLHEALAVDAQLESRMKADGSAIPLYMRADMARRALTAGLPARAAELLKDVQVPGAQTGDEAVLHAWPTLIEARLLLGDTQYVTRELARYEAGTADNLSPRDTLQVSRLRLMLPLAYGSYGRGNPRLASARAALDAAMQAQGLPRIALLNAHISAGLGALAAVDVETARKHASDALALAQSQRPGTQDSAWIGAARLLQARIDLATGEATEARAAFTEARRQMQDTVEPQQPWRVEAERAADGNSKPVSRTPHRR